MLFLEGSQLVVGVEDAIARRVSSLMAAVMPSSSMAAHEMPTMWSWADLSQIRRWRVA